MFAIIVRYLYHNMIHFVKSVTDSGNRLFSYVQQIFLYTYSKFCLENITII